MKNILLIEDNESILKGLVYSLEQERFKVTTAMTIKDSKNLLESNNIYNLIILDISLPDGSGFDLCKYIKSNYNIPIIFLTAKDDEDDIVKGLELGAEDYITKPFGVKELLTRIDKIILRNKKNTIIKVKDTRTTLSYLSANLFHHPDKSLIKIAITGTKGKTSTSWIIKNILEQKGEKVGIIGTIGTIINGKLIPHKNTTPESYKIQKYMRQMARYFHY